MTWLEEHSPNAQTSRMISSSKPVNSGTGLVSGFIFRRGTIVFLILILSNLLSCKSDSSTDGRIAPLLEGMGNHHFPITTSVELVQRFFNQGLVLSYGFNHQEAERSFREAARLDTRHVEETPDE